MTLLTKDNPFIIAEVAQSHDGSLGQAHAFIDAVASTGADAIKFQTHIAEAESTVAEPWRIKFSHQDDTRFDYWRRMEFSDEQWAGLKTHAEEQGLVFLSSPFSVEAIDLLQRLDIKAWKVASGETSNPLLLEAMLKTKKHMIVSTGMSSWAEIDVLVQRLTKEKAHYTLLQCTNEYPCSPEKWGLNILAEMKSRYDCTVGLSDHSGTIFPAICATTLGADIIEIHVALSKYMFGPDVPASVSVEELSQLVTGCRSVKKAIVSPIDKDQQSIAAGEMRKIFGQVLMLRQGLKSGSVITRADLTAKKSNGGISVSDIEQVIGRKLTVDIDINIPIQLENLL